MGRECAECGKTVVAGQGRWAPESKDSPTLTLRHKSLDLCERAREAIPRTGEGLAKWRLEKSLRALDALDEETP